jgi:hypothetical protein
MTSVKSPSVTYDTGDMINFITRNIDSLTRDDHICILQILFKSPIDESKIKEKPFVTQIKFADIPVAVLGEIYDFMTRKITDRIARLENYTSSFT